MKKGQRNYERASKSGSLKYSQMKGADRFIANICTKQNNQKSFQATSNQSLQERQG